MLTSSVKFLLAYLITVNVTACTQSTSSASAEQISNEEQEEIGFSIDGNVKNGTSVPFIKHEEDKPFGSYVVMNLPYEPVKALYQSIEKKSGQKLITRGEAHITVITPVEFDKVLKRHLTIGEITKIATDASIQSAAFEITCLGKGELKVGRDLLVTYFVVTPSEQLLEIRKAVEQKFISSGGTPGEFNAESFYPHITVGYSKRDLHFEDGVMKDDNACIADLRLF
jgi:2'-5' RNA ligase